MAVHRSRLRAAAQGGIGGGPRRPRPSRGRRRRDAGTADRRRIRPAAQDAPAEPQGHARRTRCARRARDRSQRRAETVPVDEFVAIARKLPLVLLRRSPASSPAKAGPRAIARDQPATCGHGRRTASAAWRDVLGARQRARLDHRLALDGKRVAVGRLQRQRLVGQADRLAESFCLIATLAMATNAARLRGSTASAVSSASSASIIIAGGERGLALLLQIRPIAARSGRPAAGRPPGPASVEAARPRQSTTGTGAS